MPKTKTRDNVYWMARLKKDKPDYYARYRAGEFKSVRQTCIAAGLIHQPTRTDALLREWRAASPKERRDFVERAKGETTSLSSRSRRPTLKLLVDPDGLLTAPTAARVTAVMKALDLKSGAVLRAMGYKALDPRLGFALVRHWAPSAVFLRRLGLWLAKAEKTAGR